MQRRNVNTAQLNVQLTPPRACGAGGWVHVPFFGIGFLLVSMARPRSHSVKVNRSQDQTFYNWIAHPEVSRCLSL